MLTKLILENYTPLLSSGITKVELDTTEKINLFISKNGTGKELANSSLIKVPRGWRTMGSMKVGTRVTGRDGKPTRVTGVYPQGVKRMFEFTFQDGRSVKAGLDHLWEIYDSTIGNDEEHWVVIDTKEILERIKSPIQRKLFIPLAESEVTTENIKDPFNGSTKQRIALIMERLYIDNVTIDKSGTINYTSNNTRTIKDLIYLVRSIGGIAEVVINVLGIQKLRIRYKNPKEIIPHSHNRNLLPKKNDVSKLELISVVEVEPEEATCITVANIDKLFITNDFIVTHNSSVLKELNQLPPENGNFDKGGRKFTETYHNGLTYVLDSYTGVSNGHSFVTVDSEGTKKEHNPNGTFTVQKDLTQMHFGLDSKLVRVLSGIKIADRISVMSATARKDLLMQIYPNDTEYALGVYNKLRIERNELKAAIKNQVSRHADETRKLKDLDEVGLVELERRINQFESELKEALLIRGGLGNLEVDPYLADKISRFGRLTDQLTLDRSTGFQLTENELIDKIELTKLVEQHHRDTARSIQVVISENRSGLDGLEEFLKDPEMFKEQAEQLEQDYQRIKLDLDRVNDHLSNYELFNNIDESFKGLEDVCNTFSDYLGRITVSSNPEMNSSKYKELLLKAEQLQSEIQELVSNDSNLRHKLKHYEQADLIECPDCTNKFKVGFTKEEIDKLRLNISVIGDTLDNKRKQLVEVNKQIENDADWYSSMNQLISYVRENDHVRILPELLKEYNVGRVLPNTLQNLLYRFSERSKLLSRITALESERSVIKARLDVLERNNLVDVSKYLNKLETDLVEENRLIRLTELKIINLRQQLSVITNYQARLIELTELKIEIFNGLEEETKSKLKELVDRHISELTDSKEMCLASIIKSRSLHSVVESINNDLTNLKKRLKAVEVLISGLCPNKGLIGKMMSEFIETICGNMNSVIQKIWDTTLFVKPSSKENGDLTYKFPVVTGDRKPSPDISDCSGGETDIIDWAFRFVLLNYIKYPFPLIMDEVGSYLDEIKRGRFFNFIKEHTELKNARQLFMVSHYFVQYAVFKNVNTIAFKYEGLTIDGEVNQNTTVE